MPYRRLPQTNASRDSALTTCKEKMDAIDPTPPPFSAAKATQLTADQPMYHSLIVAANTAKSNQTNQSAIMMPLLRTARFWVSHGFQALINACIRDEFPNSAKNFYGLPLEAKGGPDLGTEAGVIQGAITYNDGETERIAAGGDAITFPSLANINTHVDAFKASQQTQSILKGLYDDAQESLSAANTNIDLLILQLWNSIEAEYDTGDKPSMRRKAREWGVIYVPSKGEAPSGDDFSVLGMVKDSVTGLPLENVEVELFNATISKTYITEADGMFYMPPVPTDTYTVKATLIGYLPFNATFPIVEGEVQQGDIILVADVAPLPPEE